MDAQRIAVTRLFLALAIALRENITLMKIIMQSFGESFGLFKKDKWIALFSLVPVLVGTTLYTFLGTWMYNDVLGRGRTWIGSFISSSTWGNILYYLMMAVMTVALFFIISWTFVLVVSLISCPFNDIISVRVEKLLLGKEPDPVSESFLRMGKKLFKTIFNELKKISFVLFMSILAFFMSFAPFLAPLGIIVSALLLAAQFLDYSWSRHNLSFGACLQGIRKSFLTYTLAGGIFLGLLSVPFVNLFVLPFAVVYFTVIFIRKHEKSSDPSPQIM